MTATDLFPTLADLNRADKLRVMQFLVSELAREEDALLSPGTEYPVWTPHETYSAADALLTALASSTEASHA